MDDDLKNTFSRVEFQKRSSEYSIPYITAGPLEIKLLNLNLITEYYKERYFYFQNEKNENCIAISDLEQENLLNKTKQHYKIFLIKEEKFNEFIEQSLVRLNTIKAKYYLDFLSPSSCAKNTKYRSNIAIFFLLFLTFWFYFNNLFNLINNIIYLIQNLFKAFLFMGNKTSTKIKKLAIQLQENELPIYTIFVPLYKEIYKLKSILQAIDSLDYPKSKLDVKFIIETDDYLTIKALQLLNLPNYIHVIKVPFSLPRTKPKAMNYAMSFIKGEYLVIYDAEDQPESKQLLKALEAFENLPDEYVCVQARLNFYNAQENILTRFFSAEYSLWFDYLLKGLSAFDLPVPLGGTSNHFKVAALRAVGGWDAYNVTEDADLGIRLSVEGYKVHVFDSITLEESPISISNWLHQRSRWIKGFIQTTMTFAGNKNFHNKLPMFKQLGIYTFIGMSSYSFFCLPWLIITNFTNVNKWVQYMFLINGFFLLVFMYSTYLIIIINSGRIKKMKALDLLVLLCWPFYFLLHSIACYIAILQTLQNPFKWNKTAHGESKEMPDV